MSPDKASQVSVQTPAAPTPPPVFASDPSGKKPKGKNQTPSTLMGMGGNTAPTGPSQSNQGFKTLTGT